MRPFICAMPRHVFTTLASATLAVSISSLSACALWDAANDGSDDPNSPSDAALSDANSDTDLAPEVTDDISQQEDSGQSSACQVRDFDGVFALDSLGSTPQFQVQGAFDGEAIWVVYVSVEDATIVDFIDAPRVIVATRISCAGETLVAPFPISTRPVFKRYPRPSIDIKDEVVHFAWESRESAGSQKNNILYRAFRTGGEALAESEKAVEFIESHDEATAFPSVIDADVVGLWGGGALVAGRTVDGPMPQVYLQQVNHQGESAKPAIPVSFDLQRHQVRPEVTVDTNDRVWVSWQESRFESGAYSAPYAAYRSFELDDPNLDTSVETLGIAAPIERRTAFNDGIQHPDWVYMASVTNEYGNLQIALLDIKKHDAITLLGVEQASNNAPAIATKGQGGVVTWFVRDYQASSPDEKMLYLQSFQADDDRIQLGERRLILTQKTDIVDGEMRGGPSVVHLGGGDYLLLWHQGRVGRQSQVNGRFVRVEHD